MCDYIQYIKFVEGKNKSYSTVTLMIKKLTILVFYMYVYWNLNLTITLRYSTHLKNGLMLDMATFDMIS